MILLTQWSRGRLRDKWHDAKARETARYRETTRRSYRKLHVIGYQGAIDSILGLVMAAGGAVALALGTMDVLAKSMSVGDLVVAMTYVAQLYAPLHAIGTHLSGQQQAVASVERGVRPAQHGAAGAREAAGARHRPGERRDRLRRLVRP
jgi:ABC-type multidrug transport system fused ATPase/permease subunit